ncbi:MAG: RICIN domain-containing protein, partial [Clostridiales Family XIII bacterium]|nr:RICIN domain-containing protein [Clostridiales Family XIII bacterium]
MALSFALLFTLLPDVSFADSATAQEAKTANVPESNLSGDFIGKIVSLVPKSDAGLCLDVKGSARAEGAAIIASKKKGGMGQRFQILEAGNGLHILRSSHTGRLLTERDGEIVQTGMTSATDDAQRWAITKRS